MMAGMAVHDDDLELLLWSCGCAHILQFIHPCMLRLLRALAAVVSMQQQDYSKGIFLQEFVAQPVSLVSICFGTLL